MPIIKKMHCKLKRKNMIQIHVLELAFNNYFESTNKSNRQPCCDVAIAVAELIYSMIHTTTLKLATLYAVTMFCISVCQQCIYINSDTNTQNCNYIFLLLKILVKLIKI